MKAVVAYGWESKSFYAKWLREDDPEMIKELIGPALNIGSPQSKLAPKLLDVVREILLIDKDYVERVKEHYAMFREKIDGRRPRKMSTLEFKSEKRNRNRIKRKKR